MDRWCGQHPYPSSILNTSQSGNPAVRHVEVHTEAAQRGERDVPDRIYPVSLYTLFTVILAQLGSYLKGSLQCYWMDELRHAYRILCLRLLPRSLMSSWQELDSCLLASG